MTITRRSLWDEISLLDKQIETLNESKADCFAAYREQLKDEKRPRDHIALEIAACKKAFRRLRALDKNADAVLEQDALVDEIVGELQRTETGTDYALACVTREPIPTKQTTPPAAAGSSVGGETAPSSPVAPGAGAASTLSEANDDLSIPNYLRCDTAIDHARPS